MSLIKKEQSKNIDIKPKRSLINTARRADLRDYFGATNHQSLVASLISKTTGLSVGVSVWDFTLVVWYINQSLYNSYCGCNRLNINMDELEYIIQRSDPHWELRCRDCKSIEMLNSLHCAIINCSLFPKSLMIQAIKAHFNDAMVGIHQGSFKRVLEMFETIDLNFMRVSWK